jgi:hypothetical protein
VTQPQIITDAELVSRFASKAMEEPASVINTRAPAKNEVSLVTGFLNKTGEVIKIAEVRELNGVDEEAISKAGSSGKALNVILQRGLVSLGDTSVTKEDLDSLVSGDRDAILLGIRRVTFGETINLNVTCGSCNDTKDVSIHLVDDVPIKEFDESNGRTWTVELKDEKIAVITLPNGALQRKIMENLDKTTAELNTIIIAGCLLSINGTPSAGASTVLKLGIIDRETLLNNIMNNLPGPRLGEVKKVCEACGEKMSLPLNLADLFRV